MNKFNLHLVFWLSILFLLSACGNPSKDSAVKPNELTLFVAASLTDVITVLADSVEKDMNTRLKLNLASSGTLARQLKEGMPCDIYFSASKQWMDYVSENELVDTISRCAPARNQLVLIASKNQKEVPESLEILPEVLTTRLSIGDPAHVPAGKYAEEAIKSLGMYNQLGDRLLPAKDVRSALMVVELGEADFGVVYKTDALKSKKVKVVTVFPDVTHSPIVYQAAIIKSSPKRELAQRVMKYLTGEKSRSIWEKYGFAPEL